MKKPLLMLAVLVLNNGAHAQAQDWKPCAGPLLTRWAKDVSPTNTHPEYPPSQLVRKAWLNLNGHIDFNKTPPWWSRDIDFSRNLP